MTRQAPLKREDIERYLRQVGEQLNAQRLTGEILIVGGAFMTLVLRQRETTRDVDAYFARHADAIRQAAKAVALSNGLPGDWLNDAAKGFMYAQPRHMQTWLEVPGLRVYAPDPEYIFAMKALAGRPEDLADLRALRKVIGLTSASSAILIIQQYVPNRLLTPRVQYLIEDLFEESDV